MTREADIRVAGRATSPAREELRRRLLALVLAAVLVWYTVVIPPGGSARSYAARPPDDDGRDGEVRGRAGGTRDDLRAYSMAGAGEGLASGPPADGAACESVEDLDWPEYIYPG
jgi:hypothetical protein